MKIQSRKEKDEPVHHAQPDAKSEEPVKDVQKNEQKKIEDVDIFFFQTE